MNAGSDGSERKVTVALGARSYDIVIGSGLLARAGDLVAPHIRAGRAYIVTDRNVANAHHLQRLTEALSHAGVETHAQILPPGEGSKSMAQLEAVIDSMMSEGADRKDVVIALGGGVIGDLTGLAAGLLKRGMRFIQIPTTLLAQVDSSVGGKTAINSKLGKNLIGLFNQPELVIADLDVLSTLPPRELKAGLAEVIKYGLIDDPEFFDFVEANADGLAAGDETVLSEAVRRSVQMKADIVARDETETGDRALLNLGHTFGHALEAATGYSDRLLHGEGVAIGCALAVELSTRLGLGSQEDPSRVRAHLAEMGMKRDLSDIPGDLPDADGLLALMAQDKKVVDGQLRFILTRGIGHAFVADDVPPDVVRSLLAERLAD